MNTNKHEKRVVHLVACLLGGFVIGLVGCQSQPRKVIDPLPQPVFRPRPRIEPEVRPSKAHPVPPGIVEATDPWMPPRLSSRWRYIVIHHSAMKRGSASAYDRAHRDRGWDELGYHFVIGNGTGSGDGEVEVGSRWLKQKHGAHAKTPDNRYNDHGIGICLVGDFTHAQPTPAQMDALVRLTGFLMQLCDVPPDHVLRHSDVNNTQCPGRNFPWARFKNAFKE